MSLAFLQREFKDFQYGVGETVLQNVANHTKNREKKAEYVKLALARNNGGYPQGKKVKWRRRKMQEKKCCMPVERKVPVVPEEAKMDWAYLLKDNFHNVNFALYGPKGDDNRERLFALVRQYPDLVRGGVDGVKQFVAHVKKITHTKHDFPAEDMGKDEYVDDWDQFADGYVKLNDDLTCWCFNCRIQPTQGGDDAIFCHRHYINCYQCMK